MNLTDTISHSNTAKKYPVICREGGRIYLLFHDSERCSPNVRGSILDALQDVLDGAVGDHNSIQSCKPCLSAKK